MVRSALESTLSRLVVPTVAGGLLLASLPLHGQTPTLNPSGGGSTTPTVSARGGGGGGTAAPATAADPGAAGVDGRPYGAVGDGFFIPTDREDENDLGEFTGVPPTTHVVQRGDTLWDLCAYYFANPWRWPEVWSYNPEITNPHWIYPGDLVRLGPEGDVAPAKPPEGIRDTNPHPTEVAAPVRRGVELRQLAFVSTNDMKFAGTIEASAEEKQMLSSGDEVYIKYGEGKPPQIGKRYAIYTPKKDVRHPNNKGVVGTYVELRGEVEILDVKKDKAARGRITYVNDVVERGQRVGPLKTQFREVDPVPATKNLDAVIVDTLGRRELIGEDQVVFIDRGSDDGVKNGNVFRVVRRGDATPDKGDLDAANRNDRAYPDEAIARVMVVEAGRQTSIGLVIESLQEVVRGDRAILRK